MLEEFRKNKERWGEAAYEEAQSDARGGYDENEKARYALLIQIQYDFQESDRELIHYLFEQEVTAREKDSFQGVGNSLWLGAFLLAKFNNPNDIPIFYRAKNANFDTYCGFDIEFVFWPLKENTDTYLAENNPELLKELGGLYLESKLNDTIDDWWDDKITQHPDCIEKEHLLVLHERSLYFDNMEEAKEYLELWASNEPASARKDAYLEFAYKQTHEFEKAIEIVKSTIDSKDAGWDKTEAYRDLLELSTLNGAPADAIQYVKSISLELNKFDCWKQAGLGHMTIRSVFNYSYATNDPDSGKRALDYADAWSKQVNKLPFTTLEAGIQAAEKWNMSAQAKKYRKLAKQERIRIDSML